ncbi:DMT family transporter [Dickeya fangzhongdai]|uniref:EamA family transporter n=1 Tax=Dickeya fangzhongdai TaxID=1778540 RepID=A0A2K8QKT3_9GAMM|nr:DMT family transporter [Dickeya fangzhongdai]ATZ94106.1 EamA family transporter [Dickeya fangzhongdai]MBO8133171.1 DMT family transporter [Dickeya fangzhongdai]QOH47541.1 DMT family transporter [Dickeya fangzhongdai]QOH51847.1 DMT family transporter [Dickeya fangzhongdai]WES87748.1 DMT family transporter [Dickeya fangzhongdai]
MNSLLYCAVVLIWGTTWIAISLQQGSVPPEVSIFWRFAIASALLMAFLILTRRLRPLSGRAHLLCMAQGVTVFGINFFCFYHAVAWIPSGLESVIFSMAVLFNAFNSRLFFGTRLSRNVKLAAPLGLAGIILLFWHDLLQLGSSPQLLWGVGMSLIATYCFSLGNIISAQHQRMGRDIMTTNGWGMLYGALAMGFIALLLGYRFTPEFSLRYLGSLSYLALFGSVIGFGAYFALVGRIGASQAAYATLLFPLVALSASTLYEGYVWRSNAVLGLLLILAGNAVMFYRPRPQPVAKTAA